MKVVYFTSDMTPQSGASYALLEIVKRMEAVGVVPIMVLPDKPAAREMVEKYGFLCYFIPEIRLRNTLNPWAHLKFLLLALPTVVSLRRILRENGAAAMHINEIYDIIGAFAARISGFPCVATIRAGALPQPAGNILLFGVDKLCHSIVVPSLSAAKWLTQRNKSVREKIRHIEDFAFDPSEYADDLCGKAVRKELGIENDVRLVTFVGKMVRIKGQEDFIRAAAMVAKQRTKVVFLLVGDALEGHAADAKVIRDLAAALVPGQMHLVGFRKDLARIYAASDIVINCPTYPDTYPTVTLLPMLAGKAVLGTRIGGIIEQIEDKVTGVLANPGDPADLAEKTKWLLDHPEERSRLGDNARRWIRGKFSPKAQGEKLLSVYEDACGCKVR